jgi:hypothetical protein
MSFDGSTEDAINHEAKKLAAKLPKLRERYLSLLQRRAVDREGSVALVESMQLRQYLVRSCGPCRPSCSCGSAHDACTHRFCDRHRDIVQRIGCWPSGQSVNDLCRWLEVVDGRLTKDNRDAIRRASAVENIQSRSLSIINASTPLRRARSTIKMIEQSLDEAEKRNLQDILAHAANSNLLVAVIQRGMHEKADADTLVEISRLASSSSAATPPTKRDDLNRQLRSLYEDIYTVYRTTALEKPKRRSLWPILGPARGFEAARWLRGLVALALLGLPAIQWCSPEASSDTSAQSAAHLEAALGKDPADTLLGTNPVDNPAPARTASVADERSRWLYGVVVDARGSPVSGALVWLDRRPESTVTTGSDGHFALEARIPDTLLAADAYPHQRFWYGVVPADASEPLRLTVVDGARLHGDVRPEGVTALTAPVVELSLAGSPIVTWSSSEGTYELYVPRNYRGNITARTTGWRTHDLDFATTASTADLTMHLVTRSLGPDVGPPKYTTYTLSEAKQPIPVCYPAVARHGRRVYLVGGRTCAAVERVRNCETRDERLLTAVQWVDLVTHESGMLPSLPLATQGAQAVAIGGSLWVFGGMYFGRNSGGHLLCDDVGAARDTSDGDASCYGRAVWSIELGDPAAQWEKQPDMEIPRGLGYASLVPVRGGALVLGGKDRERYRSAIWSFDTQRLRRVGDLDRPTYLAQACAMGNRLYTTGGSSWLSGGQVQERKACYARISRWTLRGDHASAVTLDRDESTDYLNYTPSAAWECAMLGSSLLIGGTYQEKQLGVKALHEFATEVRSDGALVVRAERPPARHAFSGNPHHAVATPFGLAMLGFCGDKTQGRSIHVLVDDALADHVAGLQVPKARWLPIDLRSYTRYAADADGLSCAGREPESGVD